jgi:alanine dehydrogenase
VLILSERDVAAVLPMRDAIDAVSGGLVAQAAGKVVQPLRLVARTASGFLGTMPCEIQGVGTGAKIVTFFPGNADRAIHTHHAEILLFESETGRPIALVDGRFITEVRTGAASAVASRALASKDAGVLAVIGTGVQARSHIEAHRAIGMMRELRIWGRSAAHASELAAWAGTLGIAAKTAPTVRDACRGADIICTVTPALNPVLESGDVDDGCHINAVGSSAPHMRELTSELVARSRLVVDSIEGAMSESGEVVTAIAEGILIAKPEMVRLCDVVSGAAAGRHSPTEVTLFKSLGMALEDVACAALAVGRARERGLGTVVEMS